MNLCGMLGCWQNPSWKHCLFISAHDNSSLPKPRAFSEFAQPLQTLVVLSTGYPCFALAGLKRSTRQWTVLSALVHTLNGSLCLCDVSETLRLPDFFWFVPSCLINTTFALLMLEDALNRMPVCDSECVCLCESLCVCVCVLCDCMNVCVCCESHSFSV